MSLPDKPIRLMHDIDVPTVVIVGLIVVILALTAWVVPA